MVHKGINRIKRYLLGIPLLALIAIVGMASSNPGEVDEDPVKVAYKGVSFMLPGGWNYRSQETQPDYAYQITCWEKDGSNMFMFQWLEVGSKPEESLARMKESIKEEPSHKGVIFEKDRPGTFQNIGTLSCAYSGAFQHLQYAGRITTFQNNGRTLLILYQGDEAFTKQAEEEIIPSITIDFLSEAGSTTGTEIPENWILYEIEDLGQIAAPPTLELRDDNSYVSAATDVVHDHPVAHKNIKMTGTQLVFQPRGLNNKNEEAGSHYARILVHHKKGCIRGFLQVERTI